jgi:predicted permease
MSLSRLRALWRNLVEHDRVERDLDAEMQATLALLIDEKIAAGMSLVEARRRSRIELGHIEPVKERVRDVRAGIWIETLIHDLKYAIRYTRRSPAFAVSAILTLAIGIGANTAMLSVLNTLAFRRLAIPDPDGLFSLSSYNERGQKRYIPMPTVIDLNRDGPFIEACGYNGGVNFPVEANGVPTQAVTAFVTGRCFSVFGVQPVLGRAIVDDDAPLVTAGRKVVVISDRLWRRLFNGNPDAIGRSMKVDAAEVVIVGVLPAGFRGINADTGIDIYAPPDSIFPATAQRRPVANEVLGRLRPGITVEQASAQLDTMWPALLRAAREATRNAGEGANLLGGSVRLEPMGRGLSNTREQYAQAIGIILGLTTLLLVLACVNLGALLLTRLSARSTELGVRLALGGSRARIAQQLLIEGVLLSVAGTVIAVPVAFAFVAPMPSMIDPGFVGWELSFAPDLRVLAITAATGLSVGVLLTSLPIWFAVRRQPTIRFAWDRTTTTAAGRWLRGLLVAQVALSVVTLIGAGLLVRSLYIIQHVDPGVRIAGMMSARVEPLPGGGVRNLNASTHYPPLIEKLQGIPGVRRVAMSRVFPRRISPGGNDVGFVGEEMIGVHATSDSISLNFFEVAGIALRAGRPFTSGDTLTARRVVIVSDSLARALNPDGDVVDRRIRISTFKDLSDLLIVGVAGNATQGDLKNADAYVIYTPLAQSGTFNAPNLLLETSGDPAPIAAAVRRTVREHGREFVADIDMLDELLTAAPARERVSALLSAMIGGLAMLLAAIGIHGVLAYSVARRTREIGLRVAIGANPASVARAIVGEGCRLTLLGVVIGLPAAYFAARLVRSILFGISENDTLTFVASAIFVTVLGAIAGILPARRAARIDPAITLRAE